MSFVYKIVYKVLIFKIVSKIFVVTMDNNLFDHFTLFKMLEKYFLLVTYNASKQVIKLVLFLT